MLHFINEIKQKQQEQDRQAALAALELRTNFERLFYQIYNNTDSIPQRLQLWDLHRAATKPGVFATELQRYIQQLRICHMSLAA